MLVDDLTVVVFKLVQSLVLLVILVNVLLVVVVARRRRFHRHSSLLLLLLPLLPLLLLEYLPRARLRPEEASLRLLVVVQHVLPRRPASPRTRFASGIEALRDCPSVLILVVLVLVPVFFFFLLIVLVLLLVGQR